MRVERTILRACALLAAAVSGSAQGVSPGASAEPVRADDRFSVMTHFAQGWALPWVSAIVPLSCVRDELYWDRVEPKPGTFVWPAAYDAYMEALRNAGVSPLIVLDFGNPNYDGGMTPYTPSGIDAYARYAVETLRHYGSDIRAVEVWNEFNGSFCKGPAEGDRAADYLRILKETYQRIKAVRPDVTVVGGATSGVPLPYLRKLFDGGALGYMDALSVHPYRYNEPPEGIESDIAGLRDLMRRTAGGADKPIWVTEIGWYTKPSEAPGDLAIDDMTQAKFLVRACVLLLSAGVDRITWYQLRDDPGVDMGLYRDGSRRTAKPADLALDTLAERLRGVEFVTREETADGVYSLLFEKEFGREVRVIWALKPTALTLEGATAAVTMLGKPISIDGALAIDATDAPIIVEGPLSGLPPPPSPVTLLADSEKDFSSRQGANGWSYGTRPEGTASFAPLPSFQVTDWKEAWTGPLPYVSVTSTDQHPSALGKTPVAAVRRWQSDVGGDVRVSGQFHLESLKGDGVGVSILVDGHPLFRKLLGGGGGKSIVDAFDFTQAVRPGSTIDFAVDPGPGSDVAYDTTALTATIDSAAMPVAGVGDPGMPASARPAPTPAPTPATNPGSP